MNEHEMRRMEYVMNELIEWLSKSSFRCDYHPDQKSVRFQYQLIQPNTLKVTAMCRVCLDEGSIQYHPHSPYEEFSISIPD